MARYRVEIERSEGGTLETSPSDQQKDIILDISDTNLTALKDYIDLMAAGTNVSSVKTAIDLL